MERIGPIAADRSGPGGRATAATKQKPIQSMRPARPKPSRSVNWTGGTNTGWLRGRPLQGNQRARRAASPGAMDRVRCANGTMGALPVGPPRPAGCLSGRRAEPPVFVPPSNSRSGRASVSRPSSNWIGSASLPLLRGLPGRRPIRCNGADTLPSAPGYQSLWDGIPGARMAS